MRTRLAPFLCLLLLVAAWMWPVTLLGRRPVGGEVTSVHLPLMSFFGRAVQDGRVPLWNEQAGFGTPALADGQIGVFYPLHQIFYRMFDPHVAFTFSLFVHMVLAAAFAYLCGRAFELSRPAAGLAAIVFVGQGFFIAHQPQPWSYTTACWLPLAVMAVWRWLETGMPRWLLALAAVLGIQLLAGHFQIAFYTHVTVLLVVCAGIATGRGRRIVLSRRGVIVVAALAGGLTLAAVQLLPTAEMILNADTRGRGFVYLASFANHPIQLVKFLAPTLLHQHPFWEPIFWIPRRSSPAESLNYIGLIPLGLALCAVTKGHRERSVQICFVLASATLLLSFGPYLPGFRSLITLPGFNWFSASGRWSVVSGLFLGLLAGRGFELLDVSNFRRWLMRYAIGALVVLMLATGLLVLSFRNHKHFNETPHEILAQKLINYGYEPSELYRRSPTPASELPRMLRDELTMPVLNASLLIVLSLVPAVFQSQRSIVCFVLLWSGVDLGVTMRTLSPIEFSSAHNPLEHSSVVREIATDGSKRVVATMHNFWMLAGAVPLGHASSPDMNRYWHETDRQVAYLWNSEFPTVPGLVRWGDSGTLLGRVPSSIDDDDIEFIRLSNIRLLICGPDTAPPRLDMPLQLVRQLDDPWLSRLVVGERVNEFEGRTGEWTLWEPTVKTSRAWTFPLFDAEDPDPGTDPRTVMRPPPARRKMLDEAQPADKIVDEGERVVVSGKTDSPAVLVLSDLRCPGWEAELIQRDKSQPVEIEQAFGGWRAVFIPKAGEYRVVFNYRPESFRIGRNISLGALAFVFVCIVVGLIQRRLSGTSAATSTATSTVEAAAANRHT